MKTSRGGFDFAFIAFMFGGAVLYMLGDNEFMWRLMLPGSRENSAAVVPMYVCVAAIGGMCGMIASVPRSSFATFAHILLMPLFFLFGHHVGAPGTVVAWVYLINASAYLLLSKVVAMELKNAEDALKKISAPQEDKQA